MRFVARILSRITRSVAAIMSRDGQTKASGDEALSDAELEAMFDAHVSNSLAALPRAYLDLVPSDLSDLIRSAKAFHEVMDTRGAEQEAELAEAEIGFRPRHHVRLRTGPHGEKYMAIPTAVRFEYAVSDLDARVERMQIKRAGGVVIDAFGGEVPTESQMAHA